MKSTINSESRDIATLNGVYEPRKAQMDYQAEFFDENPPLYPWPWILRKVGLSRIFKPREAMWRDELMKLELQDGDKLLDVGCGTGIWLDRLACEYGLHGTGIDVSRHSLKMAKWESVHSHDLAASDARWLPYCDGSFNFVLCLDVLEHFDEQSDALREIARVLKPDGNLFIWTLNKNQAYTWNWWLDAIGVDVYDQSAHDPNLLPDGRMALNQLSQLGIAELKLSYFNSFFTLALDEAIMVVVSLLRKLGAFGSRGKLSRIAGTAFIFLTHHVSIRTTPFLNWLDRPWRKKGASNGFLVVGRKPVTSLSTDSRLAHLERSPSPERFPHGPEKSVLKAPQPIATANEGRS